MKSSMRSGSSLRALLLLAVASACFSFQPLSPSSTRISTISSRKSEFSCRQNFESTFFSVRFPGSRTSNTQLEASPVLQTLSSPIGSFLVLTGIVLVHECGHYLAARYYGVKVEEFSIGFGPRVAGFEAWGNEFNFRAFPLGGYVRFPENYNTTLVAQQQGEIIKQRKEIREERKESGVLFANRRRTLGYRIVNILTLGSLDQKRKQEEEETRKNLPFWKSVFKQNKKKEERRMQPLPNPDDVEIDYYGDPDLLQNRPWFQKIVVLSGGVIFNLLLAFFIYFGEITSYGLPQPVFDQGILVSQNPATTAAANKLLRKGDVILGVNGNPLTLSERPTTAQSQKAINDFISTIRSTPDDEQLKLSVLRNNKSLDITIQPKRAEGEKAPKTIGVLLTPNFVKTELLKVDNPVDAIVPAAKLTYRITAETANGLLTFFGTLIMGKDTGGQGVSGPIGLLKSGSDIVATNNWGQVLAFAAAISVNLGVVNAFPLPALDGGQIVFVLVEAVTKRKVDQRLQEEIIGVTVLLLLLVSVSAAIGDVQNLLK